MDRIEQVNLRNCIILNAEASDSAKRYPQVRSKLNEGELNKWQISIEIPRPMIRKKSASSSDSTAILNLASSTTVPYSNPNSKFTILLCAARKFILSAQHIPRKLLSRNARGPPQDCVWPASCSLLISCTATVKVVWTILCVEPS